MDINYQLLLENFHESRLNGTNQESLSSEVSAGGFSISELLVQLCKFIELEIENTDPRLKDEKSIRSITQIIAGDFGEEVYYNLWKFWFLVPGSSNVVDFDDLGGSTDLVGSSINKVTNNLGKMKFIPSKIDPELIFLPVIEKLETKIKRILKQKANPFSYAEVLNDLLSSIKKSLKGEYRVAKKKEFDLKSEHNNRVVSPLLDFINYLFGTKLASTSKELSFDYQNLQNTTTSRLVKKRLKALESESKITLYPDMTLLDENEIQNGYDSNMRYLLLEYKTPRILIDLNSPEHFNKTVINKSLIQTYSYALCIAGQKSGTIIDFETSLFIKFPKRFTEEPQNKRRRRRQNNNNNNDGDDQSNGKRKLIANIQYYIVDDSQLYNQSEEPTFDQKFNSKILLATEIYNQFLEDEEEPKKSDQKRRKLKASSLISDTASLEHLDETKLEFNKIDALLSRTRSELVESE
ncbi:unnamed protein product [Wickerhamomyces anomalus]